MHKVVTLFFIGWLVVAVSAAKESRITVDWLVGSEPSRIEATANYAWSAEGWAVYYDQRTEESERTLERLDLRTGVRARLLDPQQALASLQPLFGDEAPKKLSWPIGFDRNVRRALYRYKNDLFVLDIPSAVFRRLTEDAEEETAPQLSPDGGRVAFVKTHDLYTVDVETGTVQRRTFDGSETLLNGEPSWVYWEEIFNHEDGVFWWSPDSRSLAFLQTDQSKVSVMTFVDFQPVQPRVLKQYYPKAGQTNPTVRLGIIELDGGDIVWANLPDDFEYIVNVDWLPHGRSLSVLTLDRQQKRLDMHIVDRHTGNARLVLRETDDDWIDHYPPFFLSDGRRFVWTSERSGYAHLYLYDLDGRLIRPLTSGEWSVLPFGMYASGEQPVLVVDEKAGWVYFMSNKDCSIERQLYRCRLNGGKTERVSQGAGTHQPLFDTNGRYYLDRFSSAARLPSVSLHRGDGHLIAELAPPRPELLDSLDIRYPQFLTLPARDGFPLPAMIFKPKDFDPQKKYPVIFYVYGGPSAPTVVDQWMRSIYFYRLLLDAGYLVMSVDNRASAYIGKRIVKSLNGRVMGQVELNDLVDAVRGVCTRPFVDPQRLGIYGASGGGMYTLLAMTHTDLFKAGISRAPVTDWHYYDTKFTELIMKRPEDNPDGYTETSLVAAAKNLHGRLLLIHGTYDDNVHIQNSWAFADELIKSGKVFDMMIYPMRKHSIHDVEGRRHLYELTLDFWLRNL